MFNLTKKNNKAPEPALINPKKKKAKIYLAVKRKHRLKFFLERAGIYINEKVVDKILFNIGIAFTLIISSYLLYYFVTSPGFSIRYILFIILIFWTLVFPVILFIVWMLFYLFLDLRAYKRRFELEEVLPDFLQLTASNIRAGMIIDRALWYAVRPRFGILAKEIETVAKETMGGRDLRASLIKFSEKFDSVMLRRTISLVLEGMNAGGNMGDLISKIAIEIDESKVLQKEMAANVSNYIIFIGFASVVAAPILFALGHQFIGVIQKLSASAEIPKTASAFASISFSSGGLSSKDFRLFATISLTITSFFSSLIIATIKKGDMRHSVKYVPIFIIASILLFYLVDKGLSKTLSSFF